MTEEGMIEYKLQCRYDGGYEGRWDDSFLPVRQGSDAEEVAKRDLHWARKGSRHTRWEYRLVSRKVTPWEPVEGQEVADAAPRQQEGGGRGVGKARFPSGT